MRPARAQRTLPKTILIKEAEMAARAPEPPIGDQSSWAVHFPGNLRWTNAMQIVKGMVPYAAVAMDEVERVGRRLKARAAEADLDRVWREEWAAIADRVAAAADTAVAEGRHITAGHHYMRAGNYYYSAERFIPPGADKMPMYRK